MPFQQCQVLRRERWVKDAQSVVQWPPLLTCGTKSWEESWTVKVGTWLVWPTRSGYEWYEAHLRGDQSLIWMTETEGFMMFYVYMGYTPNGYLMPDFFWCPMDLGKVVPWQPIACRWCRSDPIRRLWSSWNRCYAKINSQKQYNKSHRKWCDMTATTGVSLE